LEPGAIAEAVDLCLARPSETQFIAGGTDLLTEIKEGVANPKRLVGLSAIPGLQEIQETEDGLSIGAMTTIAEVAEHPVIRSGFAALAEAAAGLATPQIRNLATLGGNLNQRPRCW
jgi:xanthine dehydrogenase YagS FAD-binding subunit